MPKIYKEKDKYFYKIPAYNDLETCKLNNKLYGENNFPTYSDVPESMFEIMCALIIDFVEKEDPLNIIDWDYSEDHAYCRDEFMKLYKWAKAWPAYEHRIENQYLGENWKGGGIWTIWIVYENKIIDLQDQFMKRLIDIRMGLWT
jgi:hypothetical protein